MTERLLPHSDLVIVPATVDDIQTIVNFRTEAAQWLGERGSNQWANPLSVDLLTQRIHSGQTWIVRDGEAAAGTITLTDSGDPSLWTEKELNEPSLYIHKLSVIREYSGNNLGGELLNWAGEQAKQQEKQWLRLDCWSTNTRLQEYYKEQGFMHLRTIPHRNSGALFQRVIS